MVRFIDMELFALRKKQFSLLVLATGLGALAIIAPALFHPGDPIASPIFPKLALARAELSQITVLMLFIFGMGVGFFDPAHPALYAIAAVAVFPVLAVYEKSIYLTSHSMISFEILSYMLCGLAFWGGIHTVRRIRKPQSS